MNVEKEGVDKGEEGVFEDIPLHPSPFPFNKDMENQLWGLIVNNRAWGIDELMKLRRVNRGWNIAVRLKLLKTTKLSLPLRNKEENGEIAFPITEQSFFQLLSHMPNLHSLSLSFYPLLNTPTVFQYITKRYHYHLKELNISYMKVMPGKESFYSIVSALPRCTVTLYDYFISSLPSVFKKKIVYEGAVGAVWYEVKEFLRAGYSPSSPLTPLVDYSLCLFGCYFDLYSILPFLSQFIFVYSPTLWSSLSLLPSPFSDRNKKENKRKNKNKNNKNDNNNNNNNGNSNNVGLEKYRGEGEVFVGTEEEWVKVYIKEGIMKREGSLAKLIRLHRDFILFPPLLSPSSSHLDNDNDDNDNDNIAIDYDYLYEDQRGEEYKRIFEMIFHQPYSEKSYRLIVKFYYYILLDDADLFLQFLSSLTPNEINLLLPLFTFSLLSYLSSIERSLLSHFLSFFPIKEIEYKYHLITDKEELVKDVVKVMSFTSLPSSLFFPVFSSFKQVLPVDQFITAISIYRLSINEYLLANPLFQSLFDAPLLQTILHLNLLSSLLLPFPSPFSSSHHNNNNDNNNEVNDKNKEIEEEERRKKGYEEVIIKAMEERKMTYHMFITMFDQLFDLSSIPSQPLISFLSFSLVGREEERMEEIITLISKSNYPNQPSLISLLLSIPFPPPPPLPPSSSPPQNKIQKQIAKSIEELLLEEENENNNIGGGISGEYIGEDPVDDLIGIGDEFDIHKKGEEEGEMDVFMKKAISESIADIEQQMIRDFYFNKLSNDNNNNNYNDDQNLPANQNNFDGDHQGGYPNFISFDVLSDDDFDNDHDNNDDDHQYADDYFDDGEDDQDFDDDVNDVDPFLYHPADDEENVDQIDNQPIMEVGLVGNVGDNNGDYGNNNDNNDGNNNGYNNLVDVYVDVCFYLLFNGKIYC